jgi:hypothetical protein
VRAVFVVAEAEEAEGAEGAEEEVTEGTAAGAGAAGLLSLALAAANLAATDAFRAAAFSLADNAGAGGLVEVDETTVDETAVDETEDGSVVDDGFERLDAGRESVELERERVWRTMLVRGWEGAGPRRGKGERMRECFFSLGDAGCC